MIIRTVGIEAVQSKANVPLLKVRRSRICLRKILAAFPFASRTSRPCVFTAVGLLDTTEDNTELGGVVVAFGSVLDET